MDMYLILSRPTKFSCDMYLKIFCKPTSLAAYVCCVKGEGGQAPNYTLY